MGAPRHSPEAKAAAMGALYASCDLVNDEMIPNFYATSRRIGVDHQTLMRWWRARDLSADEQFRAAAAQARQQLAQEGARSWLVAQLEKLKQRHQELITDDDRWGKADLDVAARAAKTLTESIGKLDALLDSGRGGADEGAGAGDPDPVGAAVDRALARATRGGATGGA